MPESETKSADVSEIIEEISAKDAKNVDSYAKDFDIYAITEENNGWYTKRLQIGSYKFPPYNSAFIQLLMTSFICFLCPGIHNALSGMGGGGRIDASTSNIAGIAFSCVSILGFFYGGICNRLGVNQTMALGGIGYSVYAAAFLCYNHTHNIGFVIFGGVLLGACCNFLWSAQGTVMMSYPIESHKGLYISVFWIIFNLGAVIGSIIPLANNIHVTTAKVVADGTYAAFIALMAVGALLGMCLLPAGKVIKSDGTRVIIQKNPSWRSEIQGFASVFHTDTYIIALFPLFLASNFFYTYQFNDVNAARFSTRTRALNNLLYWFCQMFGSFIIGYLLDWSYLTRRMRAKVGVIFLFVITMAIWGGGWAYAKSYTRAEVKSGKLTVMDWSDSGYIGPMFLFMFYGVYDAMYQTFCYWLIGSLTNNARKLAIFAGFYKGMQCVGGIIVFCMDWKLVEYHAIFGTSWALLAFGILLAVPIVFLKVKESTAIEEDLKFSDETLEDVIGKRGLEAYISNGEEEKV
ncbi:unnamed protein product [Kuraishia capsulata CBS 1993]|uniref:Major facilitator superfamily (MFS) profile domain-containing protein n=1 Tax=Kuraishia capsulata CBS 1993 TaxID=1382522 RepID=W6MN59_9ASCO|nr:uncharacterized protein KUCA_T00004001001 [Kuraishia capsulata CBS 1993]CDK28021.1 unnamed protein product [Kuraishia capsulata CBS 1993]